MTVNDSERLDRIRDEFGFQKDPELAEHLGIDHSTPSNNRVGRTNIEPALRLSLIDNAGLLNNREAAHYLNISEAFLNRDRWKGASIPFIRIGSRAIRYRKIDLQKFVESRIHLSTSEYET